MEAETKPAPPAAASHGRRQTLVGVVTSAKMEKTIVVRVTRTVQHGLYRRVMRVAKKYYAHDEHRQARLGDKVRIVASRPLSKLKRWRLVEVVGRAGEAPGSREP
jgi:small subunit ribosomal protein S17